MIDCKLMTIDIKNMIMYMIHFNRQYYDNLGLEYLNPYLDICASERNRNKITLEFYLIYKLLDKSHVNYFSNIDCSSLETIVKDYKTIYPWLNNFSVREQRYPNKYELYSKNGIVFRGNIMTEIETTLRKYILLTLGINKLPKNLCFEDFVFKNLNYINISDNCRVFIQTMHCFGNFIPAPLGFGPGRSNSGIWDFWDIAMIQIFKYYLDKSDKPLEDLFKHANPMYKQDTINNCKQWLNMFENWQDFLDQNFLNCYVDAYKRPIELFSYHLRTHPVPETLNEMEELFRTASNLALDRMHEMGAKSPEEYRN